MGSCSLVYLLLFIYVFAFMFVMGSTLTVGNVGEIEVYQEQGFSDDDEIDMMMMSDVTPLTARGGGRVGSSRSRGPSPTQAPAPGPSHQIPVRSLVAVQGVVYCKPCKYKGVGTLLGASPLPGAVVRLVCNNSRNPIKQDVTTDKNGYFYLQATKKITNYGVHKCKMYLVSSPLQTCNKPTDLHMGLSGSSLIREQKQPPSLSSSPIPTTLYSTLGPFAFDPASCPPHP